MITFIYFKKEIETAELSKVEAIQLQFLQNYPFIYFSTDEQFMAI